jgi:CRP-like cAMP-binding protein
MISNLQFHQNDPKHSIIQRVIDGSMKVDSMREFEELLEIYPQDPLLLRRYADLLHEKQLSDQAFSAYDRTANLFIENGMNLQAIVAKILQWSIRKPSHAEGRSFHSLLHEEGSRHTPLQRFWARMSYPELITVMLRLVRVRIPAGETILSPQQRVDHIFFVVSGKLSETPSPDCEYEAAEAGFETEPILLGSNDIFGDIFPIDLQTTSRVAIRSVSETELVKIPKQVLHSACRNHPRILKLLKELHKSDRYQKCERAWQTVRRTVRFGLPTQVDIIGQAVRQPQNQWRHTGIALDLSLGGMCIDLGPNTPPANCGRIKGQIVQVFLDLHNDATMNLTGVIVWHRKQAGKPALNLIGIRFDSMSPGNRQLLMDYCSGNSGEQNLLWSLWDSMVKMDNA